MLMNEWDCKNRVLLNGDEILFSEKNMIYKFAGPRRTCSTSPLNGGSRDDLEAVFNFDETPESGGWCRMKAERYDDHLSIIAQELGLNPSLTSGLSTTVTIGNSEVLQTIYHGKEIVVICTAGVDVNAARAGDPSGYDEATVIPDVHRGTINIFLSCDVNLPHGSLSRLLITLTEAKTAALQELLVGSCYSEHLATGSGTDGILVINNPSSDLSLTNTGPHSKLGEIIGKMVKRAVKKALYKQTGLDALRQLNVYQRLKRFNIEEMLLLVDKETLEKPINVALVSNVAHILDQMSWGLLHPEVALEMSGMLMNLEFEIEFKDLENAHHVKDFILRGVVQYLLEQKGEDK